MDWYRALQARILSWYPPVYEEKVAEYKSELFSKIDENAKLFLELGIGTGANFKYFSCWNDVVIYGVDTNKKMERYARESASEFGISNSQFHFIHAAGESLPVGTSTIDVVVSTLVLCSVKDVTLTLREVIRVLKPGGAFIFVEHVTAEEGSIVRLFQFLFNPVQKLLNDGCNLTRDTFSSVEDAGFARIEAQRVLVKTSLRLIADHVVGIARTKN